MKPIKEMNAVEAYEYIEAQPNLEVLNPFVLHFDSLSAIEKQKARDFPFMNLKEFDKKYSELSKQVSPEEFFTPEIRKVMIDAGGSFDPPGDSPEETGFVPDVSEEPANAWEETALPDPEILQPDDDLPF